MKKILLYIIIFANFLFCPAFSEETNKNITDSINIKNEYLEDKLNYKNYIKKLNDINKIDKNCVIAYYYKAVIYDENKKMADAISEYTKAIKLQPYNWLLYFNRGICYYKKGTGSLKEATKDFQRAMTLNPTYQIAEQNYKTSQIAYDIYRKLNSQNATTAGVAAGLATVLPVVFYNIKTLDLSKIPVSYPNFNLFIDNINLYNAEDFPLANTSKKRKLYVDKNDVLNYKYEIIERGYKFSQLGFSQAAMMGNSDLIEKYIKAGFDANSTYYNAPIIMFAIYAKEPQTLETFLNSGANPNATVAPLLVTAKAQNTMSYAIKQNSADMVKILIKYNVDVNQEFNNKTPLYRALLKHNNIMVKDLLKAGAKIDEKSKKYVINSKDQELKKLFNL